MNTSTRTRVIVRRALTQPVSIAPAASVSCSNAEQAKFHYAHPDNLYEYWYQRASRDGNLRGELRVRIARGEFERFIRMPFAQTWIKQELVRVTFKDNGWVLVTGAQLPKWDERRAVFHDALGVFVREFNKFYLPKGEENNPVFFRVEPAAAPRKPIVKDASGTLRIQHAAASENQLAALARRFSK